MMADPFTIRILVPDGDTEGARLIDRMNWTGLGVATLCGRDRRAIRVHAKAAGYPMTTNKEVKI